MHSLDDPVAATAAMDVDAGVDTDAGEKKDIGEGMCEGSVGLALSCAELLLVCVWL